jgi:molecular chaperone DnaJ
MRIPPGTQSGRVFRLAGKGLPRAGGRGDLLVTVEVETAVECGEAAEELLRAFDEACPASCHPRAKEFLELRDRNG